MTMIDTYNRLRKTSWSGIWGKRLLSELQYILELSRAEEGKYDEILAAEIDRLDSYVKENGSITKEICETLEKNLTCMAEDAKALTVLLIAHAHIDMNWMWGFNETVSLTVSTFETMLKLMEEYPQFKFSQSQASVYRIVEEYAPYLLPEIRQRIKEGRWEVTASTWVENDKNMSSAESMSRHLLYTRNYLSELLDIQKMVRRSLLRAVRNIIITVVVITKNIFTAGEHRQGLRYWFAVNRYGTTMSWQDMIHLDLYLLSAKNTALQKP